MPMKKYMNDIRKIYKKNYTDEQIIDYIFADKRLQRFEYFYKTRDKSRESREHIEIDKNIHEKPYVPIHSNYRFIYVIFLQI